MIDYEYPNIFITEGTQKDLLITDGTVTIDGTDYEVSGETVLFENNDLELEAFELQQNLCSELQLQFGFCGTAKVSFVARKSYEGSIVDTRVKVYIIPNHDASKMLQLGVFRIYEDKQSNDHARHSIVGYDRMYEILNKDVTDWYDDILQDEDAVCELVDFRDSFAAICGVDEEDTELVNDDYMLKRTIEKDRISGADIIKSLCEINGVFGVITNEGKLRYKQLVSDISSDANTVEIAIGNYIDVQYEYYLSPAIRNLRILNDKQTNAYSRAGTGSTYTIAYNPLVAGETLPNLQVISNNAIKAIKGHEYRPLTLNALGNPVLEVGDAIKFQTKTGEWLFTYILQRKLSGIAALRDTYTSNGQEDYTANLNNTSSQYAELNNQVNEIVSGGGGGSIVASHDFPEIIRNIGFRLLDEPSSVSAEYDDANEEVSIKWTDPNDIATNEPCPATWAGTAVVRKENGIPYNIWDGELIVDSTVRDEYSDTAFVDNTIELNKVYYYGIFPYHVAVDDQNNPIKHYRYTKSVVVVTGMPKEYLYNYTGEIQRFVAARDGVYKLEVWGAQGSDYAGIRGGYGSYSVGEVRLLEGDELFVVVGGQNGYNGGGTGI